MKQMQFKLRTYRYLVWLSIGLVSALVTFGLIQSAYPVFATLTFGFLLVCLFKAIRGGRDIIQIEKDAVSAVRDRRTTKLKVDEIEGWYMSFGFAVDDNGLQRENFDPRLIIRGKNDMEIFIQYSECEAAHLGLISWISDHGIRHIGNDDDMYSTWYPKGEIEIRAKIDRLQDSTGNQGN